ncbi:IS3 family transposase, partial [Holdemanella sp. DFI.5.55]|nr:IS3 family transposase [Holdemanella sp. DFI.5.55]
MFEYFEGDYGVRRLSAQVRDYYRIISRPLPNHKRIYRLMR